MYFFLGALWFKLHLQLNVSNGDKCLSAERGFHLATCLVFASSKGSGNKCKGTMAVAVIMIQSEIPCSGPIYILI